jgi:phosphoribosyl-AMP cyclohydrolase
MPPTTSLLVVFSVIVFISGFASGALVLFVISIHRNSHASLFEASRQQRGAISRSVLVTTPHQRRGERQVNAQAAPVDLHAVYARNDNARRVVAGFAAGRTDYWYEDEWTAWHKGHLRAKVESLTQVDHDGDPDDLVDAAEAPHAALRQPSRDPRQPALGLIPRARRLRDHQQRSPGPLWKRSTVWAVADNRKGVGGGHKPGTPGAPAKPHPYAGDDRLARALAELQSGGQPSAGDLAAEWAPASAPQNGSSRPRGAFSPPADREQNQAMICPGSSAGLASPTGA